MPPLLMRRPSASCCDIRPMTADGSRQTLPLQRQMGGSRGAQRRKSMRREIPARAGHTHAPRSGMFYCFSLCSSVFFLLPPQLGAPLAHRPAAGAGGAGILLSTCLFFLWRRFWPVLRCSCDKHTHLTTAVLVLQSGFTE